jgi:chromosome segregation ATPase
MRDARFTPQLVTAMGDLFAVARESLEAAEKTIAEIAEMMAAMQDRFGQSHGVALEAPPAFSLKERKRQIDELEARARGRFGGFLSLLTRDKQTLTQQFFETVASQLRRIFDHANRDAELWLRALMSPLEGHVREVQRQLKHRLDSVKRIHDAAEGLEDRIEELAQEQQMLEGRLQQLGLLIADLKAAIERGGD